MHEAMLNKYCILFAAKQLLHFER